MISRMSKTYGSITLFLYKKIYTTWSFLESGAVPTDRRTAERRIMNVTGNSYYVNPNTRTVTSNIKNAQVYDKSVFSTISKTLRPVDDMVEVLNTPINLAGETSVNRRTNSINLALGASIKVAGDFTLIVKEKGVQVDGITTYDNQKESQEAHDMAGALATLLRNAGGTMSETGFSSVAKTTWTENVSKVLDYFGIDTSKDFTVNGMKYTRDENGHFVSEAKNDAMEAYEQLKSSNQTYEFADERTKKAIAHMSDYYLKTVPDEAAKAWQETLEETGINPFPEGYTSVLQQLSMEQDFMTGGNDNLFGDTMESSIEAIEKILQRIDNPIGKTGSDDNVYLNREKEFYTTLLSNIQYAENEEIIDFSRFAPNAPDEVRQAFMEAAKETGYNEDERMDYISQVLVHQVENRQNGVANYTDVFGSSIASALQTAREILYDLENPLMPVSQRGENVAKYIEQEKEFYRSFIEKLEGLAGASAADTE